MTPRHHPDNSEDERVLHKLEVIDSRFHLDGITLADSVADNVADNAACARFVLGEAVPMPSWDLRAERLTVCSGIAPVAVGRAGMSLATRSGPWSGWPGAWPPSARG